MIFQRLLKEMAWKSKFGTREVGSASLSSCREEANSVYFDLQARREVLVCNDGKGGRKGLEVGDPGAMRRQGL